MQKSLKKCATSISKCHEIVDKWFCKDLIRRVIHETFYDDCGLLYYYVPNNYKKFHGGYTTRKIKSSCEKTMKYLTERRWNRSRERVDESIEHLRSEESIRYVWGEYYKKCQNGQHN